jgi:predicted NBD/HSP70 family sugar kinase
MLAVDLLPTRALVAIVDLNSRLLSQEVVGLPSDPKRAIPLLIESLCRMRASYPQKTFEGVGLSVPGRVDPATQKLVLAPNLRWVGYDVAGEIERAVGLKVEMENEANVCMVAEVWSGRLDGVRNAVLVAISEGIGTAILANGQMITGWGGLAGEFGHVTMDPNGPLCGCGRLGCWETFASTRAALRYYAELSETAPESISPQQLFALASDADPNALAAIRSQAEYLASGLHAIVAALAPEVILFTGDVTAQWETVWPIVEQGLEKQIMAGAPPRVITTTNPEFSRLRGAAALVLQRHSGYHRIPPSR